MATYRDFELVERVGESPITWKFRAYVIEESGALFWKSRRKREVVKSFAGSWVFSDSGKYAPSDVDDLCRMLEAQKMSALEHIEINPS